MIRDIVHCWFTLLYADWYMRRGKFQKLYLLVKKHPCGSNPRPIDEIQLSIAMDYACVFYFKPVLCLQRSAALTLRLRNHGMPAFLIVGVQLLPFLSHAWVELEGRVVNDKPYIREIFQVLERC